MTDSLRLLSFNILEGLKPVSPGPGERRLVDRERAQAVKSVVEVYDPDILVLNEALFCREFGNKSINYGKLLDFPFEASALYDDEWGNAILSKYRIVNHREMRIYNRGGLIAEIETPIGQVTVASYHPHPARFPENKAQDFTRLVEGISGPLIVCGDLNCINPEDEINRAKLTEAFAKFSDEPAATLDRFVESGIQVFASLAVYGLRDAIPPSGRRYTIPTDLVGSDKSSAIRIDHILVNEGVDVVDGEVIHSDQTNTASDHHPVMIAFRLNSGE